MPNIIRQFCELYKVLNKKSDFQCKRSLSNNTLEIRHTRISSLLLLRNVPSGRSISENFLKLSKEPWTMPKIPDHFLTKLVILFWTEVTNNQIKTLFLFRKTVDTLCQTYLPWLKEIWNSVCILLVLFPRHSKIYVFILSEQFAWPTHRRQWIKIFLMLILLGRQISEEKQEKYT